MERIAPAQGTGECARIRIEQQLVGVVAVPLFGFVGAVGPIAVKLARLHARDVAVPDPVGTFGHGQTPQLVTAVRIEQAQLELLGMAREHREIAALRIPAGTERVWDARITPHVAGARWQAGVR